MEALIIKKEKSKKEIKYMLGQELQMIFVIDSMLVSSRVFQRKV